MWKTYFQTCMLHHINLNVENWTVHVVWHGDAERTRTWSAACLNAGKPRLPWRAWQVPPYLTIFRENNANRTPPSILCGLNTHVKPMCTQCKPIYCMLTSCKILHTEIYFGCGCKQKRWKFHVLWSNLHHLTRRPMTEMWQKIMLRLHAYQLDCRVEDVLW